MAQKGSNNSKILQNKNPNEIVSKLFISMTIFW